MNETAEIVIERNTEVAVPAPVTNGNGGGDHGNKVVEELMRLIQARKDGDLSARAKPDKFTGDWAKAMHGINLILDEDQDQSSINRGELEKLKETYARLLPIAKVTENAPVNLMIADANMDVIYTNPKAKSVIKSLEHILKIDADNLIGKSIDQFHKNPQAVRRIVGDPRNLPHRATVSAGTEIFTLVATAIYDDAGNYMGPMVSWEVVTNEKKAVSEVTRLISASLSGDLKVRADTQGFTGDWVEIISGVNSILEATLAPISEQLVILKQMADGNIADNITADFPGDHALTKDAVNHVIASFNEILHQFKSASEQISMSITQIRSGIQGLASVAEEQSSMVEELSSSVEETDAQAKVNSENAQLCNQLVTETFDAARNGQEEMKQMVQAMSHISQESENIAKIIKVIDGIAFQTNILALNAAVEAARAGQHGKGFAVVAQEVRNLAARSAKAASETSDLIESSIKRVKEGAAVAGVTNGELAKVMEKISKVKDLVGEIATSSKEQTLGLSQITDAVGQMIQGAENISRQSEEMASASEEIDGMVGELKGQADKFRLAKREVKRVDLENGISPELLQQIIRSLQTQGMAGQLMAALAKEPAEPKPNGFHKANGAQKRKTLASPAGTLPLDADERGYAHF